MSGNKKRLKKERAKRFNYFVNQIVPELKKRYDVKVYGTFVKIRTTNNTYDYYPMGQKIAKVPKTSRDFFKWRDLSLNQFLTQFLNTYENGGN